MGQKVNPIGFRLGIIKGWDSNWYGGKDFAEKLIEDEKIRKYILARIPKGGISKIIIERTLKRITITVNTARPGVVIGKGGQEVDKIKEELKKLTNKDIQINIFEIKRPELDAKLVGESIAQQLQARISFRRAMKQAIASALRVGAEGIKVQVSGRLGGAEMARTEHYKEGRTPLHTLRADIDYALSEAQTVYGKLGIKVWIFKGEVYGKRDLTPNAGLESGKGGPGGPQGGERGDRGDRRGGNRKKTDGAPGAPGGPKRNKRRQ
ncbi:30S ribosomal protein S3 [Pontibacter saemangeumensis]|uniref:Small ribosomal subunit protein uS3 n=1 Tax=Pontibacter saemangeumensis TaxID=1084525 RepID=A0ABP8LQQ4_9BACT